MIKNLLCRLSIGVSLISGFVHADEYYEVPCVPCCESNWGTFAVGGDWLYWKTEQSALVYGTETTVLNNGEVFDAGSVKPHFKNENGYRLFADYFTADGLWNFRASYTHVPGKGRNSYSSPAEVTNFAFLNVQSFPTLGLLANTPFTSLGSSCNSKVNCFDLDASRIFAICNTFEIVPHIGLRVLWMKQNLRLNGTTFSDLEPTIFSSHLKSRFTGVGLEGGIKGAWQFYDGFKLVGQVGGSILYSKFRNHSSLGIGAGDVINFNSYYSDSSYRGIPTFDSFIGVRFSRELMGYATDIHVGWEHHLIYDTTTFVNRSGSTTLQGLTLGAAVAF